MSRQNTGVGPPTTWPSSRLAFRHPFQSFERVRVFANEQHQCGGLRIGFSAALFPFLQSSFVDPQLARKNRSRTMQPLARVADQLRINLGARRWINFVAAQSELAFAMALHRSYAFHQLAKNITLRHYRCLPLCTRA